VDQSGKIYAGGENGNLRQWDLDERKTKRVEGLKNSVRFLRPYPHGKILAVEEGGLKNSPSFLKIIDFAKNAIRTIQAPLGKKMSGVNVYYDGRIMAGFCDPERQEGLQEKNLIILSPKEDTCTFVALTGHPGGTADCLAMGPRIITCGTESASFSSIRVWGSEFYVKTELGKLLIKP
jgi:hypothetical protein